MVHINVFDNGRGRCQKQGRYGRNGCRNRADDGYTCPEGAHAFYDGQRSDVINTAAVACQSTGEDTFTENTDDGCNQGHSTDYNSTDNDCFVESFSVFKADATHNGLGQCQSTDTNQHPLADV